MENTFLITLLTALTATVMLIKATIELISAWIKHQTQRNIPQIIETNSDKIQKRDRLKLFRIFIIVTSFFAPLGLLWLSFMYSKEPVTVGTLTLTGLLVILALQGHFFTYKSY